MAQQQHDRARLPPLKGLGQQIVAYVLTSVALGKYDDCCSVEDIAQAFGRQPSRLRPTLRKLVDAGYLTLSGGMLEMVYPTVDSLLQNDRRLTRKAAGQILATIQGNAHLQVPRNQRRNRHRTGHGGNT